MRVLIQSQEEAVAFCLQLVEIINRIRLYNWDEISFANVQYFLCRIRDAVEVEKPAVASERPLADIESLKEIIHDIEVWHGAKEYDLINSVYERLANIVNELEGDRAG